MYPSNDYRYYLMHHGIQGQKWGRRRWQNEDGTYNDAGLKRYFGSEGNSKTISKDSNTNQSVEKAVQRSTFHKEDIFKKRVPETTQNNQSLEKLSRKEKKVNKKFEKRELKDEKILSKLDKKGHFEEGKEMSKLEQKYLDKGYSEKDAVLAAYKNKKAKKIAAIVLGTAVVAATAYVAYKHWDRTVDKMIPKDTILSRISVTGDTSVHEGFYASFTEHDKSRYKGLLGGTRARQIGGRSVYQKAIRLKDSLNVASQENARKAMADVLQNPEHRKAFESVLNVAANSPNWGEEQKALARRGLDSLNKGSWDKTLYDAFNVNMIDDTNPDSGFRKAFFDTLKSRGYDAIEDINDTKYSGYNAQKPMIILNTSKILDVSVKDIGGIDKLADSFNKELLSSEGETTRKKMTKTAGVLGGAAAAIGGIETVANNKSEDRFVKRYREEHPNTKLTNNEILKIRDKKR